jgi:hypothetical protein
MSRAQRKKEDDHHRLGVLHQEPFGEPASGFHLAWVVLDPEGKRGRVVRATALSRLSYPVVREGETWYPALGYVENEAGSLEEDDRTGWILTHYANPRADPAARVTGGPPTLTDADRQEILETLRDLWRRGPRPPLGDAFARISDMELPVFHVALSADARRGRLVVGYEGTTVAVGVASNGERWEVLAGDVVVRDGDPRPEDRDGWLSK